MGDRRSDFYYFGCWSANHKGHYLHLPGHVFTGRECWNDLPRAWQHELDGHLCPRGPQQIEGLAALHHLDGWTAFAFWDRSADQRPNSNSVFLAFGNFDFQAMRRLFAQQFPNITERFTFELFEVPYREADTFTIQLPMDKQLVPTYSLKPYTVNEIFYSVQGEGLRAGTANIFLRFSGCNLQCKRETEGFDCDTEFTSGRKMTATEIVDTCRQIAPHANAIILTGGEPSLQIDEPLIAALKKVVPFLAIETNGTNPLPSGIDWITVSPKTAEHTLRQKVAHEVKYVRAQHQAIPKPSIEAQHYLISPACQADGSYRRADLQWCVELVKENPKWKLSLQTHKLLNVR